MPLTSRSPCPHTAAGAPGFCAAQCSTWNIFRRLPRNVPRGTLKSPRGNSGANVTGKRSDLPPPKGDEQQRRELGDDGCNGQREGAPHQEGGKAAAPIVKRRQEDTDFQRKAGEKKLCQHDGQHGQDQQRRRTSDLPPRHGAEGPQSAQQEHQKEQCDLNSVPRGGSTETSMEPSAFATRFT